MMISVVNQRSERTRRAIQANDKQERIDMISRSGGNVQKKTQEIQKRRAAVQSVSGRRSGRSGSSSSPCSARRSLERRPDRLRTIQLHRKKAAFQRKLRRYILAAVMMLLLGVALSGFSNMQLIKAPVYKYYMAITVHRDDTLWNIAKEHLSEEYSDINSYMKEIMKINNMSTNSIYYGQKLILPYYSSEVK